MFRTLFAAALIATAPYAAPASADTAAFSCPAKGTVITTTDGDVFAHDGADATDATVCKIRVNGARKPVRVLYGNLWPADSDTKSTVQSNLSDFFPLGRDEFVSFLAYDANGYWWSQHFELLPDQRITIAAGTFDTKVIKHTEESSTSRTQIVVTYWYAPAQNVVVKQDRKVVRASFTGIGPRGVADTWEAESITLPPSP